MSNPTWGEILTEMRDELNEPSPAFFTDDGLLDFYNRAQMEFARKTQLLEETTLITLNIDKLTATLPANLIGVLSVSLVDNEGKKSFLFKGSARSQGFRSQLEDELKYFIAGSLLTLTEEQTSGASVEIGYFKKPAPFADSAATTAEGEIPEEWLGVTVQGALYYAYRKRKDVQDARNAKAEFLDGIREAAKFVKFRHGKRQLNIQF